MNFFESKICFFELKTEEIESNSSDSDSIVPHISSHVREFESNRPRTVTMGMDLMQESAVFEQKRAEFE